MYQIAILGKAPFSTFYPLWDFKIISETPLSKYAINFNAMHVFINYKHTTALRLSIKIKRAPPPPLFFLKPDYNGRSLLQLTDTCPPSAGISRSDPNESIFIVTQIFVENDLISGPWWLKWTLFIISNAQFLNGICGVKLFKEKTWFCTPLPCKLKLNSNSNRCNYKTIKRHWSGAHYVTCRGIRDTLGLNQSPGETQAMTLFICLSVNRWIWFAKVILLVCRHLIEAGATWSVEFNAVA